MARCMTCDYPVSDDRERVGARCPSCHHPLYEPATRKARPARPDEAACALHPGMESVVDCARCRKHACETCRTMWRGKVLCVACVDAALATAEATPAQAQATAWQAFASLLFGGGAWLVAGLVLLFLRSAPSLGEWAPIALLSGLVVLFALSLLAAVAVGQAVAALRGQAENPHLAVAGLCLGGLYVGVLFGLGALSLWQG
ncbi:MAG: hypothetical protein K2W96_03075 [Gemmataceae bacterium]|nr:hypothetical protein [Gemmataceae bacterium]